MVRGNAALSRCYALVSAAVQRCGCSTYAPYEVQEGSTCLLQHAISPTPSLRPQPPFPCFVQHPTVPVDTLYTEPLGTMVGRHWYGMGSTAESSGNSRAYDTILASVSMRGMLLEGQKYTGRADCGM